MATTKTRSSSQLYIDANLDFNSNKGIHILPATASGEVVEFDQMNTAIGNAVLGLGNSIHEPTANLTEAKAVTDYIDKMLMLIETLGLYRYDAQSAAASNDDTVIRPNNIASDVTPGRWIKMSASITDHNLLSGLQGGTTAQYYHLTAAELALLSGAALSKVDDTNVTLTLGGSAATSLLRAASITVGWTGTLAVGRGGTGVNSLTGVVIGNATSAMTSIAGTANQLLRRNAGNTAYEFFTPTYISGNQTITLSGEASGSGTTAISVTLSNAAVIAKVLTGYAATSGVITETDSILTAIQKLGFNNHSAVTLATNSGLTLTGQQLAMGTPSTITSATTNSVTTSTHTHAITASLGFIGNGSAQYQTLVTGSTPFTPTWVTSANLFGPSGLNSLSHAAATIGFVKMTDTNTFSLDTNTYALTSHTLESHPATVTAGKLLRGSGANTYAWSTLTMPDTITALSMFAANSANVLIAIAAGASQSLRVNAGGTAWEAYTPAAVTPSALTKTDDTNVTITLGGSPTAALLAATSITVGWTGTLGVARGGTGAATLTGVVVGNGASAMTAVAGTASQLLRRNAGNTAYEFFTPTYISANQTITLSGDVSGSGTTAITTTIGANKVTLGMMATVPTQVFLGRTTAGTGNVQALTVAEAQSMLGLTSSNLSTRVYRASPSGTINGSNVIFTINALVLSGTEEIYKNGILMNAGAGNDYTITYGATTTITFATAPSNTPIADIILVNYSV